MASISEVVSLCTHALNHSPKIVPFVRGKPGMGKSDSAIQIGKNLGIPEDRILIVHINDHDVVDFTGVPTVEDRQTVFNPTEMFYRFREGTGPGLIVLEELPQSTPHHQTWASGFILERRTPTFKLDPEVRIMATGNRIEDKAGVRPLLSMLSDRLMHIDVDTSVDDWCTWALDNSVDPLGIAFIRLRPDLLNNFDPTQTINATQRSWTKVFTQVPTDMPSNLYRIACQGLVGEGPAAEWVASRSLMASMPSPDEVRMNPERTEIPEEPAARYAIATSLASSVKSSMFDRDMAYVGRMPREYQVVYVTGALTVDKDLKRTKEFISWAMENRDIFMGGHN